MDVSLVVQTSTSGDYRAPQSGTAAPAQTTIPFLANLDDTQSEIGGDILEMEPQVGAGRVPRAIFSGKLFSLKNNMKKRMVANVTTGNWGGRMFDYDQKYEIDEWGAEMDPESRFCKMYVDETEIYDLERVDSWRDVLDVLLVFIGLFSAIVTTFVIQTSQALQPDYSQLTATLVYNLVLVQRALANNTIASVPLPEDPTFPRVSPSSMERLVNGLWFTSLAISLSTALVTILTKQWLYHYMSQTSGTSRDRARLRQFRFAGLEKYHVPMIIDLLPVALHVSLALFLVGLALFLYALDRGMAVAVIVVSGIAYLSYIISAILPLYDPQCPYQSPISSYLHHFAVHTPRAQLSLKGAIFRAILNCIGSFQRLAQQVMHSDHSSTSSEESIMRSGTPSVRSWAKKLQKRVNHIKDVLSSTPASLQAEERQVVLKQCHQLDIDAITWLFSTSSNSTVRKISFLASVGIPPSAADTSKLCDAVRPYCFDRPGLPIEGLEHSQIETTGACIDGLKSVIFFRPLEDVPINEEDGYHVFSSLILPLSSRNIRWSSSKQGQQLVIADFLAPGPRAHLRLPHSVWRLCIDEFAESALDPITVMRLLQTAVPQREDDSCRSPSTFSDAIANNPHLQSLMLDLLTSKLDMQRDIVPSLTSIPLLQAIIMWAVPHLDNSELDVHSVWGEKPYETALLVVQACQKHNYEVLHGLPMDSMISLRDRCTDSLSHALIYESPAIQWKAYFVSANLLYHLWRHHPGLLSPPELLSALLSYCTSTIDPRLICEPVDSGEEYYALRLIPHILSYSVGDARALYYDMLRNHNILPITLARSGGDESYLSQFWTKEMCQVAVFLLSHAIDPTAEWVQNWIRYIDTSERLPFIFKRVLQQTDGKLSERVAPLLDYTAASANWSAGFPSLIALLEDNAFITSIEDCRNPRHQLSHLLLHMQKPTSLTSVDLSMYIIPLFDEEDNKIFPGTTLNATNSRESVALLASESPSDSPEVPTALERSDPSQPMTGSNIEPSPVPDRLVADPLQPMDDTIEAHSSNNKTITRVWNKTKAMVRFAKPLVPPPEAEQTPKEMEEAGAS